MAGSSNGYAAEADVDPALLQGGNLLQAGQLQHGHLGAGPGRAEVAQDGGQVAIEGAGDKADAEPPAPRLRHPPGDGPHAGGAVQDLHGLLEQHAPRVGQAGGAAAAFDQDDAQLGLQLLDLPAERGLRDAQPGGGPGEAALLGYGDEAAEVAEFQAIPFRHDPRPRASWTAPAVWCMVTHN